MTPRKKVLLVDDNVNVLNSLDLTLNNEYEILNATNGLTALNLIAKNIPDIILLDLNIPDIDGEIILEILYKNEKWRHIPVIIISGYEKPSKELAGNVKGFLGKPVSNEDLRHAIKQLC